MAVVLALLSLAACSRITNPEGGSGGTVAGDVLYIGTSTGRVIALDTRTGEALWRFELQSEDVERALYGTPAVVDGTVYGMGRGAGNCPLELLLMYLDDPHLDVRPILKLIDRYAALRNELRWGYHVPYAVTGWLNLHPLQAIERMRREPRYECMHFFEKLRDGRSDNYHHKARTEQVA